MTLSTFTLWLAKIKFFSRVPNTAACSSSRGTDSIFKGVLVSPTTDSGGMGVAMQHPPPPPPPAPQQQQQQHLSGKDTTTTPQQQQQQQQHHPNVSFSNTSTRNGGAIYVNGSQLSYDTANKNAKNNGRLGIPLGGYYVQTRSTQLQPDAKVYNMFSKVTTNQAPPNIIVRQQQQQQPQHPFDSTSLVNGAAIRLSARSQAAPAETRGSSMKVDDLDLILGSKLKTSAKRQRNAKANILLEDLFGHLSMDSDSDGKYPHTVPPTQQAKSGHTTTSSHNGRDFFSEKFKRAPKKRSPGRSSLEANNGSRTDSMSTNAAQRLQKEKAATFPWDETNKTEDEKLTAWMVAENGNLKLGNQEA
ncbi:hypothetical protein ACLKA6_019405 [Drosophila palustris]